MALRSQSLKHKLKHEGTHDVFQRVPGLCVILSIFHCDLMIRLRSLVWSSAAIVIDFN